MAASSWTMTCRQSHSQESNPLLLFLTYGSSNPVIVRFPDAADRRDAGLAQEVRGQVAEPLLRDDHVRLEAGNLLTRLLDPLLLHLQQRGPAK